MEIIYTRCSGSDCSSVDLPLWSSNRPLLPCPSLLSMKSCVFFILCILAFVSPQDATVDQKMHRSNCSPTRKSNEKVSTKVPLATTHRSHSATGSPIRNPKTSPSPSHTRVPTRATSSRKVPIPISTSSAKTIETASSHRNPNSQAPSSNPASAAKYPKSSSPTTTTTAHSMTTRNPTGTPTLVSTTKTLTVKDGQTASALVGWVIVGVGIGGAVAVEGSIFPIEGGTAVIIEENSSGDDEPVTIDTSTTPTTTSTSTSTSSSTSSSTSRSLSRSLSRSSSSSTASPTPYNIYPKPGSTRLQQSAFAQDLERIAQPGSVRSITGGRDQLLLWVASLTPGQTSEVRRNPVVLGLNVDHRSFRFDDLKKSSTSSTSPSPQCPLEDCSHQKRDGIIRMQRGAREELKMFSQPMGVPLSSLPGYAFDSKGGLGITVYVIDSGINPDHLEFRYMEGRIRWLFLPDKPRIKNDNSGHGTCVASKVASPNFGVAKTADMVVVKVDIEGDLFLTSDIIAAWGVVARDIASRGLQGRSVVTASMTGSPRDFSENELAALTEGIRDVIELDAPVVVPSGNVKADVYALATYPALFGRQLPIIVVGGVEPSGIYAPYSQGFAEDLTVSAVGEVTCADREGGAARYKGTSFAAPAVAGLAAYFMSLDQYRQQLQVQGSVARNVRDLIKSLAYARLPRRPAAVWNGLDSRQFHCPFRRDIGPSGCPARNTTSPIIPPVAPPTTTTTTSSSIPPPPSTATGLTSTVSSSIESGGITVTVPSNSNPIMFLTNTTTSSSTTTTMTPVDSSNPLPSSRATGSSTTLDRGKTTTVTLTMSLGGSSLTVAIQSQ